MERQKKFPKFIKNVPYEIKWVDTFGYSGWFSEEEIDKRIKHPATSLTIGYFVKERNGFIVLAMGQEIEDKSFLPYNSPKFIPRGYIKSIRKCVFPTRKTK